MDQQTSVVAVASGDGEKRKKEKHSAKTAEKVGR